MLQVNEFWGKHSNDSGEYHPLAHHCADVAACFEVLAEIPSINRTFCRLGCFGSGELPAVIKARLAVFVFLHDIGKTALGFQFQVYATKPIDAPPRKGHLEPIANLLWDATDFNEWLYACLGLEEILNWSADTGYVTPSLMMASLAHHGTPIPCNEHAGASERKQWRKVDLLDPAAEVKRHGDLIRQWFPEAFVPEACVPEALVPSDDKLPANPHFHHFFAGLVALADWIGSDQNRFEFVAPLDANYMCVARQKANDAINAIGLNISSQRCKYEPPTSASRLFGYEKLRPLQKAVLEAPLNKNVLILEAETGAGKTEAALLRFFRLYENDLVDGLYFAVPTRTAAIQLHSRIMSFISKMLPNDSNLQVVLAVPGYYQAGTASGIPQPEFTVQWDDEPNACLAARRWAAENSKRYLAAQIAVGTVDQVMLSELPAKHSHMRSSLLSRHLLVIDELHASDRYMHAIIQRVVKTNQLRAGHVLMMSATLGADARQRWLGEDRKLGLEEAIQIAYPSVSYLDQSSVAVQSIESTGASKKVEIQSARCDDSVWLGSVVNAALAGAKVLVIRNTVDAAINTFEQLLADSRLANALLFQVNGVHTLHHGRFAAEDRKLLDAEVERWLGKDRNTGGGVVVGTQTLEMSLDIDADLLVTDLCPVDVLLQRIGRLHRHQRDNRPADYQSAQVLVLTPDTTDLSVLLARGENGLGPKTKVYPDVIALQNTLELVNSQRLWVLPKMNRQLVEGALHYQVREKQLKIRGEDWWDADRQYAGSEMADCQTATLLKVEKSSLFTEKSVCFPSDKKVMTRLGGDKLTVKLDEPVEGPFGWPVSRFVIPDWLLTHPLSEYLEIEPEVLITDDGLKLLFPKCSFLYGATGLQLE